MFERGFKTWCEQQAVELRRQLGLRAAAALPPEKLAAHLKIRVLRANEVEGVSDRARKILALENAGWSAVTLEFQEQKRKLVILNETHSPRRQSSDLMHELAHHLCEHTPAAMKMSKEGVLMLETYSRKDEEEADWLSGCMLLPRAALLHIKRHIANDEAAAGEYLVSRAMLKYRMDVTGVNYQYRLAAR